MRWYLKTDSHQSLWLTSHAVPFCLKNQFNSSMSSTKITSWCARHHANCKHLLSLSTCPIGISLRSHSLCMCFFFPFNDFSMQKPFDRITFPCLHSLFDAENRKTVFMTLFGKSCPFFICYGWSPLNEGRRKTNPIFGYALLSINSRTRLFMTIEWNGEKKANIYKIKSNWTYRQHTPLQHAFHQYVPSMSFLSCVVFERTCKIYDSRLRRVIGEKNRRVRFCK